MTVDATKLNFYSGYPIDKIIGIFYGSFTATSRPFTAPVGDSHPTGINDLVYFVGTFTVDGSQPQDIGSEYMINGEIVQALGASINGTIQIYYNNSDSITHLITYEIAIISKPSNTLYTPGNLSNNTLYFYSGFNYQKIAVENTEPISIAAAVGPTPTDTVITIPHNLGYRPCVRAFVDNGTTLTDVLVRNGIALIFNEDVFMTNSTDNTNAYFRFTNNDTSVYSFNLGTRIYYDPN